jgi:hypothetical protein
MQAIRNDTIGGFNAFLAEQKKLPDRAVLSLYQFDHEHDVVYVGNDIQGAPELTEATFVPRGNTALFDAIGRTVTVTGERLARLPEGARPKRVIIVIVTDGQENASREYTGPQIRAMLELQRKQYSWEFVFLGANQDAITNGKAIGFVHAQNFVASPAGTRALYSNISGSISNYRGGHGYEP